MGTTSSSIQDETILHKACERGHLAFAKSILLAKGNFAVHENDSQGYSPLHKARNERIARFLLETYHANVNAQSIKNGWTPLHCASIKGRLDVIKVLIEYGAFVNVDSRFIGTPLHCACRNNHLKVIRYLVDNGADVNMRSAFVPKQCLSAIDWACKEGNEKVVQYLIQKGAHVNVNDTNVAPPILHAAEHFHTKIIRVLVKNGAEVSAVHEGRTVFDALQDFLAPLLNANSFKDVLRRKDLQSPWNTLTFLCWYCFFKRKNIENPPSLLFLAEEENIKSKTKKVETESVTITDENETDNRKADEQIQVQLATSNIENKISDSRDELKSEERDNSPVSIVNGLESNAGILVEEADMDETEFNKADTADFHWMVHAASSIEYFPERILAVLCRFFPDQATALCGGCTPISWACQIEYHNDENRCNIPFLLSWKKEAASIPDADGILPLRKALKNQQSCKSIIHLITAYPDALEDCNMLQEAAASGVIENVFAVLRSEPGSLSKYIKRERIRD